MKLYHGSLVAVEKPQILPRNDGHTSDFGIGFYTTITLYEEELLDKAETLARLKTFVLTDQLLFHTEKAIQYLSFVRSVKI